MSNYLKIGLRLLIIGLFAVSVNTFAQTSKKIRFDYTIDFGMPQNQSFTVVLRSEGFPQDTLDFTMPQWMPGYYQIMSYAKQVNTIEAKDAKGKILKLHKKAENIWQLILPKNTPFSIKYSVTAKRNFVAAAIVDSAHAYVVTTAAFLYVPEFLHSPVKIKVKTPWKDVATGLTPVIGKKHEFMASDFDILYDCPILSGNLEELPSFEVGGKKHRFVGYKMGQFDKVRLMSQLQKIIEQATSLVGDIPYQEYTFIGIGPGNGGIEHLNNTTVSFTGENLSQREVEIKILNFLTHEYFHHYNVKRIRPFELGPFDYSQMNHTNQLWISEGLTVYYEYLLVKRAGLISESEVLTNLSRNITNIQNNPGRLHQSLTQASYDTWKDGPFGTSGKDASKSISYYEKGPLVGWIVDLAIRNASNNQKSLDDVMRYLYHYYYKKLKRGFTDAEFRQACETIAGQSLSAEFEYIYNTKELDYSTYLGYAGLEVSVDETTHKWTVSRKVSITPKQEAILKSWLGSI
ncbi:MAG: M61 family peptidase [Flectobacillus sp.]|uniref:M61 family metallopeptidase n=1 Tax=Flectobacillus sp. TaxID=50419 RepID=UPI003B9C6C8C